MAGWKQQEEGCSPLVGDVLGDILAVTVSLPGGFEGVGANAITGLHAPPTIAGTVLDANCEEAQMVRGREPGRTIEETFNSIE